MPLGAVGSEEAVMSQVIDGGHEVRWSQVEEGFYVGNYRGNFVGYIDQTAEGTFQKFDWMSTLRGQAPSLERSMACLNDLYFASHAEGSLQ
ncbi:hypothetical protein NCCP2495_33310 [Dietzia sp. NCCP-2495]|nr:hypothetical protein NCCP2495_33310 [Dietzia sp. NCCP-2495]